MLNEKTANASLVPGDHRNRLWRKSLCLCGSEQSIRSVEQEHILEHVQQITLPYLEEKLDELVDKYPMIRLAVEKDHHGCNGKPGGRSGNRALERD